MGEIKEDRVQEILELATAGRTPLARAILEDEVTRNVSQDNSLAYVNACEDEKDNIPFWMWCTFWFILGMLFTMTIPALGNLIWNISNKGVI